MAKIPTSVLLEKARAAEEAGNIKAAKTALSAAVKQDPKNAKPLMHLVRLMLRRTNEAQNTLAILPRLLKLAPKSGLAHELAAEAHAKLHNHDTAASHADKSVALAPKSPDGLYVAATVYQSVNRYRDAITCLRTALSIRPDHMPSKLSLAASLRSAGELEEADKKCRMIFAENPNTFGNYIIWSQIGKISADDEMYLYLRDVILPALTQQSDPRCHPALNILGKAANDIGNYSQAFEHFSAAKELRTNRHDRSINRRFTREVVENTSRADFFGFNGHESENPVLIVGMPRTGSTLLEQILSNHPQIDGIGESPLLRRLVESAGMRRNDGIGLAKVIKTMSEKRARELAEIYLEKSTESAQGSLRIVNKSLHNFELLGFFARLFPRARIIRALRDPMDNCVSCYMQPLNNFHSYTEDLTSLGQYYCDFRRQTNHWKNTIPNPMMDVSYEATVADTEGMAKQVIAFLGLEWDPACLDFQNNKARVKTLSVAQVRQPIYKSSVKRWKRYEEFLDPLKAELAEFYPEGFE